jgi:hypothetical protein
VLNFSLLANGGLRVSYVGLMSFVGRRFEVHKQHVFGFDGPLILGYLGI